MAPEFDKERFGNWRYQRGGIARKGQVFPRRQWTVNLVDGIVKWAQQRGDKLKLPCYLFGHSAGAQFLSRVAAFAELQCVKRIVIANPSSYVVADLNEKAPYGMGGVYNNNLGLKKLKLYLSQPITIYLGDKDTRHKNLHNHPAAQRQGGNRLERGINVFRAAEIIARQLHWAFNWRLVIATKVGHSAQDMLNAKQARQAFFILP